MVPMARQRPDSYALTVSKSINPDFHHSTIEAPPTRDASIFLFQHAAGDSGRGRSERSERSPYRAYALRRCGKLSAGGGDEVVETSVEVSAGKQVLKGCVHPPAPVVPRISRNIDPLVSRITLVTDRTIDRQPILKRQDAEHRRRIEVILQNQLTNPRLAKRRSLPLTMKHLMEILGSQLSVFLPPSPERRSIMRSSRTYGKIRISVRITESVLRRLRHPLHLKRKDLELIHHLRHTSRNHTQVLAASEHAR